MALLHLLIEAGFTNLILCHLNHGLRGEESDGDAALVKRLAKKYALKCEIEGRNVALLAEQRSISIETAAREARHDFFLRMAEKHEAWVVFLAHHAEDQAETILANLCRGSSLAGLAGMRTVQRMDSGLHLVRPLLNLRRTEINAYLKSRLLSSGKTRAINHPSIAATAFATRLCRFSTTFLPGTWPRSSHAWAGRQTVMMTAWQARPSLCS